MANYSGLGPNQVNQLERATGLAITEVEPLDGGMANSSFQASTSAGTVVITVLDNHDEASAARLAQLMIHLVDEGIPTQHLLGHLGNHGVLLIEGKPTILKEFIGGRHPVPVPEDMLAVIGGLLARVHQVPPPSFLGLHGRRLPSMWQAELGVGRPVALTDLLHRVDQLQPLFDDLPTGLIHGDLFADNLLVNCEGHLTILDWETATIDPFVLDLGVTAVALCRTDNRLDGNRLDALVTGYQGQRAMTASELERVHDAVEYANAVLMYHRFLRHNVRYPDPSKADLYLELVDFGRSLAGW